MTEVGVPSGIIDVDRRGDGDPLVFLHPFATNKLHWRKVLPHLESSVRCITPTLPLGSHRFPMRDSTDLSPPGLAQIVIDLLDALGIERATLVGNDSGGAVAQIAAAKHPDRVSRLVLVSCDAYDVFPPTMFAYLKVGAMIPGATWLLAQSLRVPGVARLPFAFGWLTREPLDKDMLRSYIAPLQDAGTRRDICKVARGLHPRYTTEAGERLRSFEGEVLVAWGERDRFFPRRLAERLAREIPRAQLEIVEGARTFVPEDEPERLAELIRKFVV